MIAITGATGHLGRLAIESLLDRGVPPVDLVAVVRSPEKAADLAARGVQIRRADYGEPDSLATALAGVQKLLLVSGSEVGQRIPQHRNVVNAARGAGVRLLAYTSILRAESATMLLAAEHRATEQLIRESGIPFVFLRNGWYIENYTGQLARALEHGAIFGSAGEGRVSAATRADYAAAAAAVLTGEGHENRAYELGGDEAFTLPELAAEIARRSGRPVAYRDMPAEAYAEVLVGAGLPEPYARILADSDAGIARGELFVDGGDLRRLIGRATTPLARAITDSLPPLVAAA
jgi:NAD(P)H dehydrogenase (quinone)